MRSGKQAQAFKRAVEIIGGPTNAAAISGSSKQNISQLLKRGSQCPASAVRSISKESGIALSELRPDLFPIEEGV